MQQKGEKEKSPELKYFCSDVLNFEFINGNHFLLDKFTFFQLIHKQVKILAKKCVRISGITIS